MAAYDADLDGEVDGSFRHGGRDVPGASVNALGTPPGEVTGRLQQWLMKVTVDPDLCQGH